MTTLVLLAVLLCWFAARGDGGSDAVPTPGGEKGTSATELTAGSDPSSETRAGPERRAMVGDAPATVLEFDKAPESARLRVRALHRDTREPIAGLGLLAWPAGERIYPVSWDAVTDAGGYALFPAVRSGQLEFSPTPQRKKIEVVPGDDNELELLFTPAMVLAGLVVDPDGGPVPGAGVYVAYRFGTAAGVSRFARTDTQGRFRFTVATRRLTTGQPCLANNRPGADLDVRVSQLFRDLALLWGPAKNGDPVYNAASAIAAPDSRPPRHSQTGSLTLPTMIAQTRLLLSSIALVSCVMSSCHRRSSSSADLSAARGDEPAVKRHLSHQAILEGKVTIDEAIEHGRKLFRASFNSLDGAGRPETTGTGDRRARRSQPQNYNRISGPDSNACAGCHNSPFVGGGGDNVANVFVMGQRFPHVNFDRSEGDNFEDHTLAGVANERNTLGMFGSGYIELLSREITTDLHAIRDRARADASANGRDVTRQLLSKGIDFGKLTARPDGTLDTSAVAGVNDDLIVRPFHQKGVVVSLREFTNNAMNHHHGIQSEERFGSDTDPDGDGVRNELTRGDITAITLFQATLPAPGRVLPGSSGPARDAVTRGESLFSQIGCAVCHVAELELNSPIFTEPNPFNPVNNLRIGDVPTSLAVDLTTAGPGPDLPRQPGGSVTVRAFTDFKRHDMGPALNNEQLEQDGVPTSHFLTRKLWGMANEPPYMHHGRALTLREAILLHGGESQASRTAFSKLATLDQDALLEFLKSLQVVEPGSDSNQVIAEPSGIIGDEPALAFGHVDQLDIEAGQYSAASLSAIGKKIFLASFNTLDGAGRPGSTGTGAPRDPRSHPENFNRLSGPDANSCAGCHNLPRAGGGGDNVANVFVLAQRLPHLNFDSKGGDQFQVHHLDNAGNERNTLGMFGSGFVELLAREMTGDLQGIRAAAIAQAARSGTTTTARLVTKDIDFGKITADPRGGLDTSEVVGIDEDLIVKPFHQKGVVISLRQFTNNALNHHHGMQSSERFGAGKDADADGKVDEITTGDVTALTVFQAMLPVPGRVLPEGATRRANVRRGEQLFRQVGCTTCHVPAMILDDPVFSEPSPLNPRGNLQVSQVARPFRVDLTLEGPQPRLARHGNGKVEVPLYSDLKRHYMGPECDNEKLVQDGVATGRFLTKKLWGFASEPPYMHHGRATTIRAAIEMHGGDASQSRAGFINDLGAGEQAALIDFLKTLQIVPKDD